MTTPHEIQAEITALKEIKPSIRRASVFGDDHHAAIDAQVSVLEKDMPEDDIYDAFEPTGDEDIDLDEGRADNVRHAALEARRWLDGEEENPPSYEWQSLKE